MSQKGFANIVLIGIIVVLVGVVGYFAFVKKSEPVTQQTTTPTPNPTPTVTPVETTTPSPTPSPVVKSGWKIYTNSKYKFSIQYPDYLKFLEAQTSNLFEANSSADGIRVEVIDKSLDGREFLASDGVVGNSIFRYSAVKDIWEYIGMYGGTDDYTKDEYKVYDLRPEEETILRDKGYIPVKYKTKIGLLTWVGNSTNQHSTQGGDTWQIAFVESPQKQFTIKLYLKQCRGYNNSCATDVSSYLEPVSSSKTIFSAIDTLQFSSLAQ